jgi:hypothetical protein
MTMYLCVPLLMSMLHLVLLHLLLRMPQHLNQL